MCSEVLFCYTRDPHHFCRACVFKYLSSLQFSSFQTNFFPFQFFSFLNCVNVNGKAKRAMTAIPTVQTYSNDLLHEIESPATIIVYSRTNVSEAVAEKVQKELEQANVQASIIQVKTKEDLSGPIGYWKLVWRARASSPATEILPSEPIPADVKSVIICGPVHTWHLPDPLRKYLIENKESLTSSERKYYAIATMGKNGEDVFAADIESLLGIKLKGGFAVLTKSYKAFCESVSEKRITEEKEEGKEEQQKEGKEEENKEESKEENNERKEEKKEENEERKEEGGDEGIKDEEKKRVN